VNFFRESRISFGYGPVRS